MDHEAKLSLLFWSRIGAVSRIIAIAARPIAVASSMYQAGASALPVT